MPLPSSESTLSSNSGEKYRTEANTTSSVPGPLQTENFLEHDILKSVSSLYAANAHVNIMCHPEQTADCSQNLASSTGLVQNQNHAQSIAGVTNTTSLDDNLKHGSQNDCLDSRRDVENDMISLKENVTITNISHSHCIASSEYSFDCNEESEIAKQPGNNNPPIFHLPEQSLTTVSKEDGKLPCNFTNDTQVLMEHDQEPTNDVEAMTFETKENHEALDFDLQKQQLAKESLVTLPIVFKLQSESSHVDFDKVRSEQSNSKVSSTTSVDNILPTSQHDSCMNIESSSSDNVYDSSRSPESEIKSIEVQQHPVMADNQRVSLMSEPPKTIPIDHRDDVNIDKKQLENPTWTPLCDGNSTHELINPNREHDAKQHISTIDSELMTDKAEAQKPFQTKPEVVAKEEMSVNSLHNQKADTSSPLSDGRKVVHPAVTHEYSETLHNNQDAATPECDFQSGKGSLDTKQLYIESHGGSILEGGKIQHHEETSDVNQEVNELCKADEIHDAQNDLQKSFVSMRQVQSKEIDQERSTQMVNCANLENHETCIGEFYVKRNAKQIKLNQPNDVNEGRQLENRAILDNCEDCSHPASKSLRNIDGSISMPMLGQQPDGKIAQHADAFNLSCLVDDNISRCKRDKPCMQSSSQRKAEDAELDQPQCPQFYQETSSNNDKSHIVKRGQLKDRKEPSLSLQNLTKDDSIPRDVDGKISKSLTSLATSQDDCNQQGSSTEQLPGEVLPICSTTVSNRAIQNVVVVEQPKIEVKDILHKMEAMGEKLYTSSKQVANLHTPNRVARNLFHSIEILKQNDLSYDDNISSKHEGGEDKKIQHVSRMRAEILNVKRAKLDHNSQQIEVESYHRKFNDSHTSLNMIEQLLCEPRKDDSKQDQRSQKTVQKPVLRLGYVP